MNEIRSWYILHAITGSEDNYYGGWNDVEVSYELVHGKNSFFLSDEEVSVLRRGITEYNDTHKTTKVYLSKVIDKDSSKTLSFDNLFGVGLRVIENEKIQKQKAKERAEKAKITKERNKLEKLAKEAGISIEDLIRLQEIQESKNVY